MVARLKPHLDAVIAAAEGTPAAAAAKVVRNSKLFKVIWFVYREMMMRNLYLSDENFLF